MLASFLRRSTGVLVASLTFALLASAPAQASIPCRPGSGTRTLAHSATARIFEYERNGNDYACLYRSGHARYLSGSEHYSYRLVRFAGSYVAFIQNVEAIDDHVGVLNMRTGSLHAYEVATPIEKAICAEVNSLVLKPDGAVAWIATNFPTGACENPPGPIVEVHRHDRRGLAVLAHDATIDPASLTLTGSLLLWLDAEHVSGATLL